MPTPIHLYTPGLFPTWIRASATGLASAFGRIGSISAPIIIGYTSTAWGFGGVFGLTCAVLLAGVLGVVFYGVATSGQSLEELNEADPERLAANVAATPPAAGPRA